MSVKHSQVRTSVHGWIVWILSALFMFYKYALEVSPSIMTKTLMSTYHINAAELGNLTACYFYAYLIAQIPAGLLLDRYGPRKITTMAIVLCALGTLIFAKADTFLIAALGRFITGIGAAFAAVNCLKLISNWFPSKQFAFMAGLMMSVGMLGAVGGQSPLSAFINAVFWRQAIEIIGFVGLILAFIFFVVVRDTSPHRRQEKNIIDSKTSLWKSLKRILQNPQSWWLSLYSGFAFAPVMVFGGLWGVAFTEEAYGLSKNMSAQSISLIFIGFAVGAPIFGWFSDWLKTRKTVMYWGTTIALFSISIIVYLPSHSHYLLTLLLFLFGFSISSFLLCFTMIREITLAGMAATAIGFMNSFDALFGAFSDPLAGMILDLGWDGKFVAGARIFSVETYKMAFLMLPLYLIISLITLRFTKETFSSSPES